MTEIPEHLLKRSKERRAAMGLGGDESAGETPAAADAPGDAGGAGDAASVEKPAVAPAAARAAAPVPAAPPPAPPDPPYVAAAKNRKKVPMWAAPVLAVLPLWGFIYFQSLQKPPAGANDPLAVGAQIYSGKGGCAGCHGSTGAGGVGPKLSDGEVLKTFKNPLAMVHWVAFGAEGGARDNGTYGDLDRAGGPHNIATLPSAMPAFGEKLTPEELAAVVMYTRQTLSGGKPDEGFDVADFPTLGDAVTEVNDLGPGGDPKVPGGSPTTTAPKDTKKAGEKTSGSSTGSAGGSSGAGSTGGTNKSGTNDTNASGGSTDGSSSSDSQSDSSGDSPGGSSSGSDAGSSTGNGG